MGLSLEEQKKRLREEIEKLKYEYEVELPKEVGKAREFGDLKENAEYHAAKERMSIVAAKISQLSERLSKLNTLNIDDIPSDKVGFGSEVTIKEVDRDLEMKFTFVSTSEVDPAKGLISLGTPYGKALVNKKIGDIVEVNLPVGIKKFKVAQLKTIHDK